jgi:hypothetical protein
MIPGCFLARCASIQAAVSDRSLLQPGEVVGRRRFNAGFDPFSGIRADSSIAPSPPSSHTTPRCCESDAAPTPVLKRANFWLRGGLWCLHRLYDQCGLWFLLCHYHRLRFGNFFFKCADRLSEQGNRPLLVL